MKLTNDQWRVIALWTPYQEYSEMEKLAKDSNVDGHERAFTYCLIGSASKRTDSCKGSKCSVGPPQCVPPFERIGDYHTHPHGRDEFSVGDVNYSLRVRNSFHCVGAIVDHKYTTPEGSMEVPVFTTMCEAFDVAHPLYEKHKARIMEVSERLHKTELDFGKRVYEEKQTIPEGEWKTYKEGKVEYEKRKKEAEEAGVIIKASINQGIDESFGRVERKLTELL